MYVLSRNRQSSRIFIVGLFIVVACIHIAILTSMDGYLSNKGTRSETVRLLESFLIEAHESTPISSLNSSQTTAISTSISPPAEALSTPLPTVAQQNVSPPPHSNKSNTKNPSTNNQTNKSEEVLTPPITHAKHLHNPPPPYPKQSRRLGEQGRVVLAVEIDINGVASQAMISISSGYPRLDRTAVKTVLKWRFIAGKSDGMPKKMWVHIPINFILE